MAGYLGGSTNWLDDTIERKIQDERESMAGEMHAKVVSFNPQTQTATLKPLFKPRFNGKVVELPDFPEVPVRFPRAGGGSITFKVREGDFVTMRPMMRSTQNYHAKEDGSASDARSFSFSDYEAFIDGGESLKNPIKNYDPENMHIRADDEGQYGVRLSADGKVKIEGNQGDIYALLAQAIRLIAEDGLHVKTGSSAGLGIHAMQNRSALMAIADKLEAMQL
jgi:hypothetical protein